MTDILLFVWVEGSLFQGNTEAPQHRSGHPAAENDAAENGERAERSSEIIGTFTSDGAGFTSCVFTAPKLSDWKCFLFGSQEGWGMVYTPQEGQEPNWFWRWMQYLAFGHRWVKDK